MIFIVSFSSTFFAGTVVSQFYESQVYDEYVIKGILNYVK